MSAPDHIPVPRDVSRKVLRALRRRKPLWRFLSSFSRAVEAAGGSAHLVGGFVRDLVEGRPGKDVDLMVTGIPFEGLGNMLSSLPARALGIRRIVVAGKRFAVYKVATAWAADDIDVALARCERSTGPGHRQFDVRTDGIGAREDASRRDFTINSLLFAFRVRGRGIVGEVIDCFGGLSDLRRRLIRGVGDAADRLREDPLRILRAIRLRNERPGYAIEGGTWRAIRAVAPSLSRALPPERAIAEIARSLAADPPGTIDDLRRAGVLRALLPELGAPAVSRLKRRYALLAGSLGRPSPETVLLANLLVDPAAAEARAAGARAAAEKVFRLPGTEAIARRLRFPRARRAVQLVEDLHRLSAASHLANRNARIEAVFGRWEDPRWLVALYEAARMASSRRTEDFRPLLRRAARKAPLLSGGDVLRIGVPEGPAVETILERVRDATLSGEIATRGDALKLAASLSGAGPGPDAGHGRSRPRKSARNRPARRTASTAPSRDAGSG